MEGSFNRAPKNILSKALEMDICLHRDPVFGKMAGRSFPRTFERRENFIYLEKHFMRNLRVI